MNTNVRCSERYKFCRCVLASLKVAAAAKLVVTRQEMVTKSRKLVLKVEGTIVVTSTPPLCWGFTN